MSKRPRPIGDGPLKAYARRAPTANDPTRWYWQVVYHEGGRQLPVEGASGRYTTAEVRGELRSRLAAGDWVHTPAPAPLAHQTWGHLLDLYVKHSEHRCERGRLRPKTLALHRQHRRRLRLTGELEDRPITAALSLIAAEQVVDALEDLDLAGSTIQGTWVWVRAAVRWAQERAYAPPALIPRPELPDAAGVRPRVTPDDAEARAVIDALPDDWRRTAGALLRGTGCRPGELAHCRRTDWRPDVGEQGALYVHGKTGEREVWVGRETRRVMETWLERNADARPEDMLLGVSPRTIEGLSDVYLGAACEAVGVERWTAYGLRRLASTRLIAAKIDPAAYVAQMGHSYAMGLRWYADATPTGRAAAARVLDGQTVAPSSQVVPHPALLDHPALRRRA